MAVETATVIITIKKYCISTKVYWNLIIKVKNKGEFTKFAINNRILENVIFMFGYSNVDVKVWLILLQVLSGRSSSINVNK